MTDLDPEYANERYIQTDFMLKCPECGSTSMTLESNLGCREPYDNVECHECNLKWDRVAFIKDHADCILTFEDSKKARAEREGGTVIDLPPIWIRPEDHHKGLRASSRRRCGPAC